MKKVFAPKKSQLKKIYKIKDLETSIFCEYCSCNAGKNNSDLAKQIPKEKIV
jgi:biotin synthase-like enzyme